MGKMFCSCVLPVLLSQRKGISGMRAGASGLYTSVHCSEGPETRQTNHLVCGSTTVTSEVQCQMLLDS